jgi:hypothetical protein
MAPIPDMPNERNKKYVLGRNGGLPEMVGNGLLQHAHHADIQ